MQSTMLIHNRSVPRLMPGNAAAGRRAPSRGAWRARHAAGVGLARDGPAAAAILQVMRDDAPVMLIGESFTGEGAEAAHINTVLGVLTWGAAQAGVAGAARPATPSAQ
jgi:hypothetical protein